jgi:hypothetical protein
VRKEQLTTEQDKIIHRLTQRNIIYFELNKAPLPHLHYRVSEKRRNKIEKIEPLLTWSNFLTVELVTPYNSLTHIFHFT